MDPQFYSSENRSLSKKNVITLLLVGIFLLSIPFAVKLVQQQQELRSKASGGDVVNFTGPGVNCQGNECTTTGDTVQIELRAPVPTSPPGSGSN